ENDRVVVLEVFRAELGKTFLQLLLPVRLSGFVFLLVGLELVKVLGRGIFGVFGGGRLMFGLARIIDGEKASMIRQLGGDFFRRANRTVAKASGRCYHQNLFRFGRRGGQASQHQATNRSREQRRNI